MRKILSTLIALPFAVLLSLGMSGWAAVPLGYYDEANGLAGGELKQALNQIIRRDNRYGLSQHTVVPYFSLLGPLREVWRDPVATSNILLVYSSSSVDAYSSVWNREHLWPRSRGNTDQAGPDDSDLFHVVPADAQVNALRSSLYFDISDVNDSKYVIGAGTSAPQVSYDSDSWQPPANQKGDIARTLFYMDVRYNGTEANTSDLDLVSFPPGGAQMGRLNTLLLWSAEDPPDDAERGRNNLIYSAYQGNRNPFIDHPEYATAIWGTGVPGDPQGAPLARVETASASACEAPSSPARFTVSINQFAGQGGLLVRFSMSGTASHSEYSLAGDAVTYDSATGSGSVLVPQGYAKAAVELTPVADQVQEAVETVTLSLVAGDGYETTPDSSSFASATISDTPSLPVSWNFDSFSTSAKVLAANQGSGFLSLSNWTGTVSSFGGRTGNSLALVGSSGNGSSVDFNFSTLGYRNLSLSFYTRGTSSGFNMGLWSFSTDGVNFTTNSATNTATTSTSWQYRAVDFSSYLSLNNAPQVTIRYALSGASSTNGNNRIDDLVFRATSLSVSNNDYFSDGFLLDGVPVNAVGSNVGASREQVEPWHYGSTGTASVWWRWTAPANGTHTFSTAGSSFDTILAVYTGNSLSSLSRIASDDDSGGGRASQVTFNAVAGTTYHIAVDGYGSGTGNILLSLTQSLLPIVSSFSPSSGRPGTAVTINGFNLAGASAVTFGGVSAPFSVVNDGQIVAMVPPNAASGAIGVTSSAGAGESASWFDVARGPSVPSVAVDPSSIGGLSAMQGSVSAPSSLSLSGTSLPGPMRLAAPAGFEVSLDGQNFADVVEISAPERSDSATNYSFGWTNGANAGNGFSPWGIYTSQGTAGTAGAVLGNPQDSGVVGFGAVAFSQFAAPVSSGAYSWARRGFASAMSVGETMSFRWALNFDPNTSTGSNYIYAYSGGALLFMVRHGNYPGEIFFSTPDSTSIDTGIAYGDRPMTWTMTLLDANTLRVSATGRDGGDQVAFTRDIVVPGAPDAVVWNAYQLDSDIRRRAYFNDLRIESASSGGGHLPSKTVYVRLAANAPSGSVNGAIGFSSGGQSLGSVAVSGTVTGARPLVSLTHPSTVTNLVAGSQLYLNAVASNANGTPLSGQGSGVTFIVNGVALSGTPDLLKPNVYSLGFFVSSVGRYEVVARATDSVGSMQDSEVIAVQASSPLSPLPSVQMLGLLPGAPTMAGGAIALRAQAIFPSAAATNARVQFFGNGVYLGESNSPEGDIYSFSWCAPNLPGESIKITACAVADNFVTSEGTVFDGSIISSDLPVVVNLTVAIVPSVSITGPSKAILVNVPTSISAAASVADGDIVGVQFYINGLPYGVPVTTQPYSLPWTPYSSGSYELVAMATSSAGIAGVSPGLLVAAVSAYALWAQSHGLDPLGNGARGADPDGDGHPNRLEFAFGGSPVSGDGPMLAGSEDSPGSFKVSYLERLEGMTYKIQRADDLRSGFSDATSVAAVVSQSQSGVPAGWRRMEFFVSSAGTAFYRVQAVEE